MGTGITVGKMIDLPFLFLSGSSSWNTSSFLRFAILSVVRGFGRRASFFSQGVKKGMEGSKVRDSRMNAARQQVSARALVLRDRVVA